MSIERCFVAMRTSLANAFLLGLLLTGCGSRQEDNPTSVPQGSQIGPGEFALKPGQSVRLDGASELTLVAVPEDSRCPPTVQCIWAGNARVFLRVTRPRAPVDTLSLNTTLEPHEGVIAGHRIVLLSLTQRAEGDTVTANYTARLSIR